MEIGKRTEFIGTFFRARVPVVEVVDVVPLAEPHHGHPHHPQLRAAHLAGDWQETIFSLSVRVEELHVPDAVHEAAPDAVSLLGLVVRVFVVEILHLTVIGSVPVQVGQSR